MTQYAHPKISEKDESEIRSRFEKALPFFRERSPVIFLGTRYRFWERHGFVQQSLAHFLVENGIPVVWLDGAGWRPYRPVVTKPNSLLHVETLYQLPLRRFKRIDRLDIECQWQQVRKFLSGGVKPLVWIQGGIDERLSARMPAIDVFSVFDDPYCHSLNGDLASRAKLITVQNDFALKLYSPLGAKVHHLLPPVDLRPFATASDVAPFAVPEGLPKKIMGYLGGFESQGYDLDTFEGLMMSFPDWTFLLMGKTDARGERYVERFKQYPNFLTLPWQSRETLASIWKALGIQLLLYRKGEVNDGAFPTKILESLYFKVPSIATQVPKTSSLQGKVPQTPFLEKLKKLAGEAPKRLPERLEEDFRFFAREMDPRLHLAKVAEILSR